MKNISVFIIGAPKSGTTSLKEYLSQHSNVLSHLSTECVYFYDKTEFDKGESFLLKKYFFQKKEIDNGKVGIVKHAASYFYESAIRRALSYNPEMKFILLLRNPVERYISSYFMEVERSAYSKTIEKSIELAFNDENSWEYKAFNMYGKYELIFDNLSKLIPRKNLHIVLFEELKNTPEKTLTKLLEILNLKYERDVISAAKSRVSNSYKVSKSKWLIKKYNKARQNRHLKSLKVFLPSKLIYDFNQLFDKLNSKKSSTRPIVSDDKVYQRLYDYYHDSINEFEKNAGINTNWLSNK